MNITGEDLKKYIEVFNSTLDELSKRQYGTDLSGRLVHKSLLPATITCYVSTHFGVAIEYKTAQKTTIDVVVSSKKIEDIIVQAPKPLREKGPMFVIGGSVTIKKVRTANIFPFKLTNPHAKLTILESLFESEDLNWERYIEYAEVYGNHSASFWSSDLAQSRAKDEVLGALVFAGKPKPRGVSLHEHIASFREKTILVLGSYSEEGEKRLDLIIDELTNLGYSPLLIKNVPSFEHYDLSQKVNAVGVHCRFIVIDDTTPSGHLTEIEICKHNNWVIILLRLEGKTASQMTLGSSFSSNVILEKPYELSNLSQAIKESVNWAEDKLKELKEKLQNIR